MPMAPTLPPEAAAAAQTGSIDPTKFLIAAADLHNSGQLSAPVPTGHDPIKLARPAKRLKVVK